MNQSNLHLREKHKLMMREAMILLKIHHRTAERTVRVGTTYLVHVEERQTEQALKVAP